MLTVDPAAVRAALAESPREEALREKPRATTLRKWRRESHFTSVGDLGRLGDDLVDSEDFVTSNRLQPV